MVNFTEKIVKFRPSLVRNPTSALYAILYAIFLHIMALSQMPIFGHEIVIDADDTMVLL